MLGPSTNTSFGVAFDGANIWWDMARDRISLRRAFTSSESGATGGWMDLEPKRAESKKTYEPPRLATISLRPEEAVLGHCKTATGTDACHTPCASFLCQNVGS